MALSLTDKLVLLKNLSHGNYHASRISSQIGYALKLSAAHGNKYDVKIEPVVDSLIADMNKNGAITAPAAQEAEKKLEFMAKLAKETTVICVSHAHIDMNWMWGFQETAAVTVDTFRTMLDLMNEYPQFTFSQSQASVYKIIEENDPDMLEEIKARIKEGRWEIAASTWVETDKNMPNGESLARHILYTKRYLSKLLDVKPDSMQLDFEPDTFGHNWSIPEILNKGGVKYYYHCRAFDDETIYRWRSRNGAEVLVYKDPWWYGGSIEYDMFFDVPNFCKKYGTDVMLKVYGVGDHGGGPTRRDVEIIADMMTWTVMPTIKFGTYHEFFKKLEAHKDNFPVINQELNFVFTGCYTSQSRIKMSNRISEDKLFEAETIGAFASLFSGKPYSKNFAEAWKKVLFNHFHDILPGSGIVDTREYALGEFQKVLATANTNVTNALRAITSKIDTSAIPVEIDKHAIAEGGGVGYAVEYGQGFKFPQAERGNGKIRIFHLFNSTEFDREYPVEITVWDWNYDIGQLSVKGSDDTPVEWKLTQGQSGYWGHNNFKIAFMAKIPALGYATYVLTEEPRQGLSLDTFRGGRKDDFSDDDIVLENDKIKAVFARNSMYLISILDKKTGKELLMVGSGGLRYIQEDDVNGMTAWRVGPYMEVENLNQNKVRVYDQNLWGIKKWVQYDMKFKNSKVNVKISLDNNSSTLRFDITADWHEVGRPGEGVPQLNFLTRWDFDSNKYRYDIPFGSIDRDEHKHDMPGNSYAVAIPATNEGLPVMVVTDTKYGFRTVDNSISVNLIRSSYDPDPYPEYGVHHISIGVAIPGDLQNQTLKKIRDEFVHPIAFISGTKHGGDLPLDGSFFKLSGDVILSAIKTAEDSKDGKTVIIRLYDANGKGSTATLDFKRDVVKAIVVDLNETYKRPLKVSDNSVSVEVPAYEVVTIAVDFK
ncbi:MAG: glycosyl hydrolase-related protein [Oscillospiraceae bacterium]|nr:glycosyl hydrolase-related protein [Oscillospiraceae bacterium]